MATIFRNQNRHATKEYRLQIQLKSNFINQQQRRIKVSNHIDAQAKQQLENQLLEWEKVLVNKQTSKINSNNNNKKQTSDNSLQDYQSYFDNNVEVNDRQRKTKMAQTQRTKGNQAIKSKDFQQAITYYTSSITLDPKMHQSYCNRALAYLKIKQFQKCIDDCEQTLKIDKTYIKAYHRKAKALIGLNKKVQAYRCLQQGQKLEPENTEFTKQMKQLRQQMKPEQIKELDSGLIPQSQFKKITIEEDSEEDD